MKKNVLLAGIGLLTVSACQRPVALYQPTPQPYQTTVPLAPPVATAPLLAPTSLPPEGPTPAPAALLASAAAQPGQSPTSRLVAHTQRVNGWSTAPVAAATQPKPRRAAPSHRKSLREMLGLKPRPALNWWQRIPWRLKASVIVILVAMLFAILGITILAVMFGLIGAFLLVGGLKKTLKVRRPWF